MAFKVTKKEVMEMSNVELLKKFRAMYRRNRKRG